MDKKQQSFSFNNLAQRPVPSILRGFSAPVILQHETTNAQRAFLLAHDTDPFNRWQAGHDLARNALLAMILDGAAPDAAYLDALKMVLTDNNLDPAFRALAIGLPSQDDLAQTLYEAGITPDPRAIYDGVRAMRLAMATHMRDLLGPLYDQNQVAGPYQPDPGPVAMRSLANSAMYLLSRLDGGALAQRQFDSADNMTQQLKGYGALLLAGRGDAATQAFYQQWKHDHLVIDKWFSIQIFQALPDDTVAVTQKLTQHPDFDMKNPNRFRSVLGALAGSSAGFHHVSGAGYALLADWLIRLDPVNPQITARMCTAFETWRRYDSDRQALIHAQLTRIADTPNLSRGTTEMITRILKG